MCPIGQCIQTPNRPSGRTEFQNSKIFTVNSLLKGHTHRKMALALYPTPVLNESFNICMSKQGRMLTYAPAWSTAVGRSLKPCRISDPQLACLSFFFSTVYVLKVSIYTIYLYLYQQLLFFMSSYTTSHLFNNKNMII